MRKPCCDRKDVKRGAWSNQEDEKLMNYIRTHGEGQPSWTNSLPHSAGLRRCHKSCRLRWMNYLRPDLKLGSFTEDEEDLIIRLHSLLGNRWSLIAGRLPGRTDNEVKNYWNSHLKRKLMNMGVIDSNNRHLIKNVSRPSNPGLFSGSTTSSKVDASRLGGENDHLSDATSCLDQNDNTSGLMLNLNLELTVTLPSNSNFIINAEEKNYDRECTRTSGELQDCPQSPTLLLFR